MPWRESTKEAQAHLEGWEKERERGRPSVASHMGGELEAEVKRCSCEQQGYRRAGWGPGWSGGGHTGAFSAWAMGTEHWEPGGIQESLAS